jgi:hypothetical protein
LVFKYIKFFLALHSITFCIGRLFLIPCSDCVHPNELCKVSCLCVRAVEVCAVLAFCEA